MSPVPIFDAESSSSFNKNDVLPQKVIDRPTLKRSKPKVVFNERVKIIQYEKPVEYSRGMIWYCKEEYDIIKARNALIVKMTRTGSFVESEEHSFRGLEHKCKENHVQRRRNKVAAQTAVIFEQERQKDEGECNAELIANACRQVTIHSGEVAQKAALRDFISSYNYNAFLDAVNISDDELNTSSVHSDASSQCSNESDGSSILAARRGIRRDGSFKNLLKHGMQRLHLRCDK